MGNAADADSSVEPHSACQYTGGWGGVGVVAGGGDGDGQAATRIPSVQLGTDRGCYSLWPGALEDTLLLGVSHHHSLARLASVG